MFVQEACRNLRDPRGLMAQWAEARTAALTTANERLTAEIAERTRAELELQRLNRAWRVRSACNQAVNRYTEEADLLDQVCREVVAVGGYRLAWVGFIHQPLHRRSTWRKIMGGAE